jgi:Zn-finger nucleic acid-binding protein
MNSETRYPCPVCVGVKMEKLVLATTAPAASAAHPLVLDHCGRCGGVWFDAGEVQHLRRLEADTLWRQIVRRDGEHVMQCHDCHAPLARADSRCAVCDWTVSLDCPACARPMDVSEQDGLRLDFCRRCRGVWFDHAELAGIWRLQLDVALTRRSRPGQALHGSAALTEALLLDPFVLYYGVHAAGHAIEGLAAAGGAATEGLAGAAGAAGALGESGALGAAGEVAGAAGEMAGAAGEAAAGVFETVAEIIGGLFSL